MSPLRSLANGPQILQQSLSARLSWSLPAFLHLTHVGGSHCILQPAHVFPPTVGALLSRLSAPSHSPPVAVAVAATPRCGTSSPPPGSSSMYEGGEEEEGRSDKVPVFPEHPTCLLLGSTLIQKAIPLSPHENCKKKLYILIWCCYRSNSFTTFSLLQK